MKVRNGIVVNKLKSVTADYKVKLGSIISPEFREYYSKSKFDFLEQVLEKQLSSNMISYPVELVFSSKSRKLHHAVLSENNHFN